MKILVPVKRVVDPYARIRVKADGSGVELQQIKMVMNPFDEIALEEAIRLRENGLVSSVVIVSIGEPFVQETLRHGLALGADEAYIVENHSVLHSFQVAQLLANVVRFIEPQLVLMGKQAIDSDANQTAQMLAALLDWPQATNISKIELDHEKAQLTRETDTGLEQLQVLLPAVMSVDLRLNEPRYATLPNIMRAKSKPIQALAFDEPLAEDVIVMDKLMSPPVRPKGVILKSVDELFEKIKPLFIS